MSGRNRDRHSFPRPVKKTIILGCVMLSCLFAFGQEPTPPTQKWCKWAFRQIPDHRNISEVDAKAFSNDFRTLLKVAFAVEEWEQEKYPRNLGG
jgi:hypothetical protein